MLEAPDARATTFGTPYWLFAFFVFPYILTLSTITSRGQPYEIWLDIGYHIINFILIIIFFLPTLKEKNGIQIYQIHFFFKRNLHI